MKISHMPVWIINGATAYEVQIWRVWIRFVKRKYWSKWLDYKTLPYFRRVGPNLPTVTIAWNHH